MKKGAKRIVTEARRIITRFRVTDGKGFNLAKVDPDYAKSASKKEKKAGKEMMLLMVQMIARLQERLYVTNKFGLLLIFQGMDTAGKDGAIKHVMSGVNPQGCQVTSFKSPSPEELGHDYMWRCTKHLPNRGQIGIFNRSYYEETTAVRVHPEFLRAQRLPEISEDIWDERFEDFRSQERYLARNGIVVIKFFLHISKTEQKKRLLARVENPDKNWKFSANDLTERGFWKKYQKSYQEVIRKTSTKGAPWYVIPANKRWFARLVVSAAIVDALAKMELSLPDNTPARQKELATAKLALLSGKKRKGAKKSKKS